MDRQHWHTGLESIVVYGIGALIFFNVSFLAVGWVAKHEDWGVIADFAKAAGGLIPHGSK